MQLLFLFINLWAIFYCFIRAIHSIDVEQCVPSLSARNHISSHTRISLLWRMAIACSLGIMFTLPMRESDKYKLWNHRSGRILFAWSAWHWKTESSDERSNNVFLIHPNFCEFCMVTASWIMTPLKMNSTISNQQNWQLAPVDRLCDSSICIPKFPYEIIIPLIIRKQSIDVKRGCWPLSSKFDRDKSRHVIQFGPISHQHHHHNNPEKQKHLREYF